MVIIETSIFSKLIDEYLSAEDYRKLQACLVLNPDSGDVIPGSGGLRKIRWAYGGHGKRGGIRVIYYYKTLLGQILMLYVYPKNVRDDLSAKQLREIKKIIDKEYP